MVPTVSASPTSTIYDLDCMSNSTLPQHYLVLFDRQQRDRRDQQSDCRKAQVDGLLGAV